MSAAVPPASTVGGVIGSEEGLTVVEGCAASTAGLAIGAGAGLAVAATSMAGVLIGAEDGLATTDGCEAPAAGVVTGAEDGLTVEAAAVAPTLGGVAGVEDGPPVAAGAMTVSDAGLTDALSAAAAQFSEIIFSSVTTKLSALTPASVALCPMSFTLWAIFDVRSTVLVVILKI